MDQSDQNSNYREQMHHVRQFIELGFEKLHVLIRPDAHTIKAILAIEARIEIKPGELVAILGPFFTAGSGKTTLLNVISNRLEARGYGQSLQVYGDVTVNGVPLEVADSLRPQMIGFVPQMDIMSNMLTLRETLHITAQLRMSRNIGTDDKIARADAVIEELGIAQVADSLTSNLSGGERKRLSIAVEIVSEPPLLFLDEPTSGLDSHAATNLLESLRLLANQGTTILTTLHQPSARMLSRCDKLLLMSAGRVIYFGPLADIFDYFRALGIVIPESGNPADLLLVLVHAKVTDDVSKIISLSRIWQQYHETGEMPVQVPGEEAPFIWPGAAVHELQLEHPDVLLPPGEPEEKCPELFEIQYRSSSSEAKFADESKESIADYFSQPKLRRDPQEFPLTEIEPSAQEPGLNSLKELWVLLVRHTKEYFRNPVVLKIRVFQALFVGVLVGLVFLQIGNSQASIQSRNGSLFFLATNQVFSAVSAVQLAFALERPIYERDLRAGAHRIWTYFIATTVLEFPIQGLVAWLVSVIVYWMVGYSNEGMAYWQFLFSLVLLAIGAVSMGYLIATPTRSQEAALIITPLVLIPLLIFGGFFINQAGIPVWLAWIRFISIFYWAFIALSVSQFQNLPLTCTSSELATAPDGTLFCPITNGDQVLAAEGIDPGKLVFYWMMLITLWISYWILSLFLLYLTSRPRHIRVDVSKLPPDWDEALTSANQFQPKYRSRKPSRDSRQRAVNSYAAAASALNQPAIQLSDVRRRNMDQLLLMEA